MSLGKGEGSGVGSPYGDNPLPWVLGEVTALYPLPRFSPPQGSGCARQILHNLMTVEQGDEPILPHRSKDSLDPCVYRQIDWM